jgi:hypothetical protein
MLPMPCNRERIAALLNHLSPLENARD